MSMFQGRAELFCNTNGLVQGKLMVLCLLNQAFNIPARKERQNQVRLIAFCADVVDSHDVGMIAEAAHGLSFASDAGSGLLVEPFGFDEGKGDVAVEEGVVSEVDLLLAAFTQE